MRGAFNKEILRSVTHSLGRFIAIAAIVALGTGFYAGLRMTAPDMKLAADIYYDGTDLMDIRVVSTLGLVDDDISALRQTEGVEAVMPAYETDVMTTINGEQYAVRAHSLSLSALSSDSGDGVHAYSDDANYLNRLVLSEGTWPTKEGECLLSADRVMNSPSQLGDTVEVTEWAQADALKTNTYTVVGFVHSSYYATSSSMGSTTLGSGTIQQFMYVPEDDFADDMPFTEAYVKVAGAEDEFAGSDAYKDQVAAVVQRIEELAPAREAARADDLRADAQKELDDARADYDRERADATAQLDDAQRQLDDAAATIVTTEQQLIQAQNQYDAGVSELAAQRAAAESQIAAAEQQVAEGRARVEANRPAIEQGQAELAAGWAQTAALQQQIDALDPADPSYAAQKATLVATLQQLTQQLNQSQAEFDALKAQFDAAVEQVEQGAAELEQSRAQASAQLAAAQQQLDSAPAQISSGWAQLEQGRADLETGQAEYDQQKAEADMRFADAEQELADAQRQIDDIDDAGWLVMDRDQNYGVVGFESDADRVDSIAAVFPFIFFLVAALVALTTMTRMVEEERVLIGTYKALGYGRARIASKYLIYALAASGIGSAVGISVLSQVLPAVISEAYAIIYFVPAGPHPIDVLLASLAAGLGVGVTLVATWAAAFATVRERPAALMLSRAPKAGKRILLERLTPVWRHTSFSWKVTFRNLFRYKKRFIMTVIGIAGCTALLLTGLGLQDSINDIIDKQYGELLHYNAAITTEDDLSEASEQEFTELMGDTARVSSYTRVQTEGMIARGPQADDIGVSVVVPQDPAALGQFITIRTREEHNPVVMDGESFILNEKAARELGVGIGDTVMLAERDAMGNATNTTYDFTVTGIMENYIYHYAYVGPALFERTVGATPAFSTYYAVTSTDAAVRASFTDDVRAISGVKTVAYNDETIDTYRTMLRSVGMIVIVLVVAAAALAFIVLYNLTNINITERQREIATLKVLGFTPREVSAYIFREIILLSIIGCLVGLVFGVFLEGFVVVTAEVNQVMFGRTIHATSYVIAFVLTMLFTLLVMFAMRRKLHRVNMVESLKSNE